MLCVRRVQRVVSQVTSNNKSGLAMPSSILPLKELSGRVVTRWQGTEMALSEGESSGDIRWTNDEIPYLQFTQLDLQLADGRTFRLLSQLEDGTGFHGLYLAELESYAGPTLTAGPTSIFRERELSELPQGEINISSVRQDGSDAIVEVGLDINGIEIRLVAGEVHEQFDGSLLIVEPEESILVQVNRAGPNPYIERTPPGNPVSA